MSAAVPSRATVVAQLCPACGLCCSGDLFGDVELQPKDDVLALAALGLKLFDKGGKQAFGQPCACFDGKWCRIYANRPARCRSFKCRQVKRVEAKYITTAEALKTIKTTRKLIDEVRKLVRELGQTDENIPLNVRFGAVIAGPIDLADDSGLIHRRSKLMQAVGKLALLLERDFLT